MFIDLENGVLIMCAGKSCGECLCWDYGVRGRLLQISHRHCTKVDRAAAVKVERAWTSQWFGVHKGVRPGMHTVASGFLTVFIP